MAIKCCFDEDKVAREAAARGLDYTLTGGRYNEPIFYDPDCELVVSTTSNGGAYQYGGSVLIFNYGSVTLIEGVIVEEKADSVHGCWKLRKNQRAYRIRKIKNDQPYIFYNYSIGSWECLSCLLIEKDKILYEETSERPGHQGIVLYPNETVILPDGVITPSERLFLSAGDLNSIRIIMRMGLPVLCIKRNKQAFVPQIETNIPGVN